LLVPHADALSPVARKRLAAIREFSDLGSGFRVAALDLEIRGAGNLLGGEQSGHIEAIGFEMYIKLLEETVSRLKGEETLDEGRAAVNLNVDLRIDQNYIPDMTQRLTVYRRVAGAKSEDDLAQILSELHDRYGPLPASILNLADYGRLRVRADALGVESIDRDHNTVIVKFRPQMVVDTARVLEIVEAHSDATLVPPGLLKIDLHTAAEFSDVQPIISESWWAGRERAGNASSRPNQRGSSVKDALAPSRIFSRLNGVLAELGSTTEIS
jgi:transcription-repair coupling factor (superfamily II helicase)